MNFLILVGGVLGCEVNYNIIPIVVLLSKSGCEGNLLCNLWQGFLQFSRSAIKAFNCCSKLGYLITIITNAPMLLW